MPNWRSSALVSVFVSLMRFPLLAWLRGAAAAAPLAVAETGVCKRQRASQEPKTQRDLRAFRAIVSVVLGGSCLPWPTLWRTEKRRSLVINNQIIRDFSDNAQGVHNVASYSACRRSRCFANACLCRPEGGRTGGFDRFLTTLTAADLDAVVGVFWPDALFWGTTKPDLATTPEAVREYFFKGLGSRKPNEQKATSSRNLGPGGV
jgi:hypothetical protein